MTRSLPSADYSGKLSIGRSCLCFTRWSRPCPASFLMSETSPVLLIERRGGKAKQVSLSDAALCPNPTTPCPCSGNADHKIVMKLPGGKKLLLKASSAEEREEWKVRLEAAMLLPLLEKKGISVTSLPAAKVDAGEEREEMSVDAKNLNDEVLIEPDRLPVVKPSKGMGEVANQEERQGKGGEPVYPTDVYALSKGGTNCERVKETPEGSAPASEGAPNAPESALPSKKMPRDVNSPDNGEEGARSDATTLSNDVEMSLGGAPSWMGLIRREEVLEPDMMDFDYEEMFQEAAEMNENIVPRRSALINSILKQLIQTMNPSQVRLPACVLEPRSLLQSYGSAFGRSDLFTPMSDADTPQQRLELVVAFYLSQLKCMRPTRAALKPYNPLLGEIFVGKWPAASEEESSVYFLAEQVSHHPPVSAFYAESPSAGVFYIGSLATISGIECKYLVWPDVMTVENRGKATVVIVRHDEHFSFTFPSAEACDILGSKPWLQLAGQTTLTASTGARAVFTFSGEDWVDGELMEEDGSVVARLSGSWRGQIEIKEVESEVSKVLLDMTMCNGGDIGMEVTPVALQEEKESRRLWRKLTRALLHQPEVADEEKAAIENMARRRDSEEEYTPRFFEANLSEGKEGLNISATFKYPLVSWYPDQDIV